MDIEIKVNPRYNVTKELAKVLAKAILEKEQNRVRNISEGILGRASTSERGKSCFPKATLRVLPEIQGD
jgi:hypothetical protein